MMLKLLRLLTIVSLAGFIAACGEVATEDSNAVSEDELLATHHWECACTCEVSGNGDQPVSWDCPECSAEGNQCRAATGQACMTTAGETGTLTGCSEILVPNPAPQPPAPTPVPEPEEPVDDGSIIDSGT